MALTPNTLAGLTRPDGSLSSGLTSGNTVEPFHNFFATMEITPFSTVHTAVLGDFEYNNGDGVWITDSFNEVVITSTQPDGLIYVRNTIGGSDIEEIIFGLNETRVNYLNINITESATLTGMSGICSGLTNLASFNIDETTNVTQMIEAFLNCTSLVCLNYLNTFSAALDTQDMFLNTPALTNPNAAQQTALLGGDLYNNPSACP